MPEQRNLMREMLVPGKFVYVGTVSEGYRLGRVIELTDQHVLLEDVVSETGQKDYVLVRGKVAYALAHIVSVKEYTNDTRAVHAPKS